MSISEETRLQLYQRLEDVLGAAEAATLMAHLPPVGWADVATRRDLDHAVTVLEAKFETGLAEVRTEIAGVRAEIAGVRTELGVGLAEVRTEFAGVRTELGVGLAEVRTELHQEIGGLRSEIGAQTRTLFFGLAGLQISGIVAVAALAGVL